MVHLEAFWSLELQAFEQRGELRVVCGVQEEQVGVQWALWGGELRGWLRLEEIGMLLPQMAPFGLTFCVILTL